ncbi:Ribonuclease H2 subunit A [Thoreauomyces humboldtii]|nr:Ribonuclease H2 subunit A [Thoreauomyces humboldtii]
MVYAVAYVPVDRKKDLAEVGFDGKYSKVLKEEQRDELFQTMQKHSEWIGWAIRSCSPQEISACMLRRSKHNLNTLAHDTTMDLIRETIDRGVNLAEVFVDTVGPPVSYQAKLQMHFPGIRFTVAKKADSLYPVVSAASIAAKVTRDAELRGWQYVETRLEDTFSTRFGSGYPSDPNTVKWLADHMDPVFGYPQIIRFSWATCAKQLDERAFTVNWPADDEEEENADIRGYFGAGANDCVKPVKPQRDALLSNFRHITSI